MTTVGPYSMSTLIYEPENKVFLGTITTPGTFLDYISKVSPSYLHLIKLAGMEAFFNSPDRSYTLFLSQINLNIPIDSNLAKKILTMSLLKGIVTTKMLTNELVLYPINSYEKLFVHTFETDSKTSTDCNFKSCNWKCSTLDFNPQFCTPQKIECNKTCNFKNEHTCESFEKRIIQINEKTITQGDILVNGGIVHILNTPLIPFY